MNRIALALGLSTLTLFGCPKQDNDAVTSSEAKLAVEEMSLSSQAGNVTSSSIELSTNFTIGGAVADAAEQIREFVVSQLPCADVEREGATLTITYGALSGSCMFQGHTFSGQQSISVVSAAAGQLKVHHTWSSFTNGVITVSGTADVTWDGTNPSRRVVHDFTWTRLSDSRSGHTTGDITQSPLASGIATGIELNGTRAWDGKSGHFDLGVNKIDVQWADPVPQAGTFTLGMPSGKSVSFSFARLDAQRIQVTLESGNNTFKFVVNKGGAINSGS